MSWVCPECHIDYGNDRGIGICSCHIIRGYKVNLIWEDNTMANTIKFTGHRERFANQRKGRLLSADLQIVKEMSEELKAHVGEPFPRGSAIRCVYIGEKGIPFVELRNYGSTALLRLRKSIGMEFEIEWPDTEAKQVPLDFNGGTAQTRSTENQ